MNGKNKFHALRSALVLIFLGAIVFSCSTVKKTTVGYSEDLSPNRPTFSTADPVIRKPDTDVVAKKTVPTTNVNKKLDGVLDSIDRINLTKRYLDGYTIQVYSGQKREEAMNVKQKMVYEAGDLPSSLQYVQPKFRVTVGSYITRIEAQKDLVRLKRIFAAAILVPEKVALK